ncbi:uncharacterized protein LOC135369068 isoform X2 [Ornithodoros turicata]
MNGVEYGAVARGDVILVSHQETDCDFEYLLKDHLKEFPTDADCRCTRTSGGVTFHFLVSEGLTYTCATTTDVGLRLPFTFLDLTKQRFNVGSLRTRAWTAMEHELNRDFAAVMADIMAKCNEGKMGDHISTLKGQVQEVKVVMTENIEKIVERGERLDTLLDKTQELESSSTQFRASAKKVRAAMCMKNMRLWIIIGVLVTAILVLIVLFATGVIKT